MKRGVSIATLTATITIILILITTVTISANNMFNNVKISNFATEISLIQKSVDSYLLKNENDYPILDSVILDLNNVSSENRLQFVNNGENVADNKVGLFNIDYEKIGYTDLKYGNKKNGVNDIYVLSGLTGKVYYAAGFKVGDKVYYTLTDELSKSIEYKTIDSVSDEGNKVISYSQENIENSQKKVTVKIPVSYVVTSVKAGDNEYSATTVDGYNIYEITSVPGILIDVVYTHNGETKSTSYTVKASDEKTQDGYVKDGMILHYDGINNTGNGHSNTATVWKDLSGNGNDGTLINFNNNSTSGWANNYLVFDGIDDYTAVLKTKSVDELLENGNVTVEFVFKYVTNPNGFRFLIDLKREAGYPGKALWLGNNGNNNFTVDARDSLNRGGIAFTYNIELEKFYNIVLKYGYNTTSSYKYFSINNNVITNSDISISKLINNTNKTIYIGGEQATMNSNIKVYSVRIYNRALTEEEIKQNYNVDKSRFGI